MNLCEYSNIFGEPNTGVHSTRLFNIAIVDVIATFIAALFFYYLINYLFNTNISYWTYLVILFLMGIIAHRIFCVKTTVDKFLFG